MSRMKKGRRHQARKRDQKAASQAAAWLDSDGLHAVVPGVPPSPEDLDKASRLYQQSIRNSPLWDEMVKPVGKEEAERLLLKFRVEVR